MLEQIAALVKQYGQDTVIDNPDIPTEANKEVLAEATHTITGGMQNMLAGGGLNDIISLFTGGNKDSSAGGGIGGLVKNPIVSMMIGHFISKLINKFNVKPENASKVSNQLIPNVLTDLVSRTRDNSPENDSFDLDDLIGSLSGRKSSANASIDSNEGGFNLQNLLNQFTGNSGGANGGSGFDLQDIIGKITNGAQQSQSGSSGGGGLMDMIKGFIS